jgi:hypothetical protein
MFGFLSANNFYNLVFVLACLAVVYGIYNNRATLSDLIEKTVVGLGKITASNPKNGGSAGRQNGASYMDFSKMEFENNAGGQFDVDLIEPPDEEQPEAGNDEDEAV